MRGQNLTFPAWLPMRYVECNFDKRLNSCYSSSSMKRKEDCSIARAGRSVGLLLKRVRAN
jgi:hypothetical protein